MFQLYVADDAALFQPDLKHPAGLQPPLLPDVGRGDVQHAGLRGHHQLVVLGDGVTEGAQPVAVQYHADATPVGGRDHGWAIPGLHQAGVVLVEVLLLLGHALVLLPGLGDHHEQGVVQVPTGHHQQFQGAIEGGGVASSLGQHGRDLAHIVAEQGRLELGLSGAHPVDVAPQGVDFPVVGDVAVGVGELPGAQGVGAEAGVDQAKSADHRLVGQVVVKARNLVGHEQPLVDDGVDGQAANVEVVGFLDAQAAVLQGVLDDLAHHV